MTDRSRAGDRRRAPHRPRDRARAASGGLRGRDPGEPLAREAERCATRSRARAGAPRGARGLSEHAAVADSCAAAARSGRSLAGQQCGELRAGRDRRARCERFDRQFAVNLRAPLFLSERFAAQAPQRAIASIVNILDQRVFKLTPQFVSYTLAKARCMPRRACWRRRLRRTCASTRSRRPDDASARQQRGLSRARPRPCRSARAERGGDRAALSSISPARAA
jgi:NAD(P)-dependent dehydrogenase (short-subunit alcohol dehydrogenase family)